jgi:hypothetical protein
VDEILIKPTGTVFKKIEFKHVKAALLFVFGWLVKKAFFFC